MQKEINPVMPPKPVTEEEVIEILKTCYDPEIPMNIYDLGLIYGINIAEDNSVTIDMTLTSPSCPAIQSMPDTIKARIELDLCPPKVDINIVWDPPYHHSMMSDEARMILGFM